MNFVVLTVFNVHCHEIYEIFINVSKENILKVEVVSYRIGWRIYFSIPNVI
jgi:hypothetical protein